LYYRQTKSTKKTLEKFQDKCSWRIKGKKPRTRSKKQISEKASKEIRFTKTKKKGWFPPKAQDCRAHNTRVPQKP